MGYIYIYFTTILLNAFAFLFVYKHAANLIMHYASLIMKKPFFVTLNFLSLSNSPRVTRSVPTPFPTHPRPFPNLA